MVKGCQLPAPGGASLDLESQKPHDYQPELLSWSRWMFVRAAVLEEQMSSGRAILYSSWVAESGSK